MRGYRVFHIIVIMLALTACTADHEAKRQRLQYVSDCNRADTVFTERWLPTVDSLVAYFDPSSRSWLERFFSLPFREGKGVGSNDRMMAHYVRGRVYHDMGEAPQALECYQKAAEQADTTRSDCDLYTLTAVYGQMADLFHAQYLPDDEMQALHMSERLAWKDKDTLSALVAYELRIRPYFLRKDTDSIIYIANHAYQKFTSYHLAEKSQLSLPIIINLCLDRKEYGRAGNAIRLYEEESEQFDSQGNIVKGREIYYYDKGRYELAKGNTESAITYFNKALNGGYDEAGYRGLLSVYEKLGKSDSISKYAKLFAKANDDSYLDSEQAIVHQISAMYNYSRQQQVAEEKKREARSWMAGAITTVMVALLAITLLLVLFYRTKARRLQEINDLKEVKENLESLLEEKEKSADVISQEIIRLNNKNSSISKTHQETVGRLQKQIEALQQKLLDTMKTTARDADSEQFVIGFKNRLQKYHHDDQPPTEAEWNQLERAFAHQSGYMFVTSHQGMKQEHIRVCLMTVMDISESMMAYALKTDAKRIDRVKRQANKRLFGEDKASSLKSNLRPYFE